MKDSDKILKEMEDFVCSLQSIKDMTEDEKSKYRELNALLGSALKEEKQQ